MCGIVGSFGSNLIKIDLGSALRTFNHRGPDQEFFYASEIFAIAKTFGNKFSTKCNSTFLYHVILKLNL